MTADVFEEQLSEGLQRLASEAGVPEHDAQSILGGALGGRGADAPVPFGRRMAFVGVAAGFALLVGIVAVQVGNQSDDLDSASGQIGLETTAAINGGVTTSAVVSNVPDGQDPFRDLLPPPVGRDSPRYLRIWRQTDTGDAVDVVLAEQWFAADRAIAWVDPDVDRIDPERIIDTPFEAISDDTGEVGFTDAMLEAAGISVSDRLDSNFEGEPPTTSFLVLSSGGGESSFLSSDSLGVLQVATFLLPTLMEQAARQEAFDHLAALPDAVMADATDEIGRASTRIGFPVVIVDPDTGATTGAFDVGFWFDPDTKAPLQIEWRLVDGVLGGTTLSTYRDTTVIVAAGEVAAIPEQAAEGEVFSSPTTAPMITTTTAPSTTALELSFGGVPVTVSGPGPDYSYQLSEDVVIGWASENGEPTNFCWSTPIEQDCGAEPAPGAAPVAVGVAPNQTLTIVPVAADGSMPATATVTLVDGTTIEAAVTWATDPIRIGYARFDVPTTDVVSTGTIG